MALPIVEEKKEEVIFPLWQDKRIPTRERTYNFVSDFIIALLVVFLMFFFGKVICSFLSGWLGKCAC